MNDSDDPTPAGAPQSNDLPKLYSLNGIGFATFFGSMLAGFFLLAANYHALGMKRPAMAVVGAGVLVFCLYFLVVMSFVGPTSMDYKRIISMVEYTAKILSETITERSYD